MSPKKIIPVLFMSMCITLFTPVFAGTENPLNTTEVPKDVRAQQIEVRLIQIRNMDKTNLTSTEKKELRKEVKGLRKEARSGGIYLSVGAIIIIILLLILLL
ncbi:MAG: hypothetical protein Q8891_12005 [Bacteroidota bacterium]|jgi:hypothetical protein|nr:hypothetical protein [Bacteroidota bacterium]